MVKMLVMDVDGTLTDGKIYTSATGEYMKAFNVKDGYGIKKLLNYDIVPVILTGRESKIVEMRCKELGIVEVHQNVENKLSILHEIMYKYSLEKEDVAYIGDDENDLECMMYVDTVGCPSDAVDKVKKVANFVSKEMGGNGAIREFIEYLIRIQFSKVNRGAE